MALTLIILRTRDEGFSWSALGQGATAGATWFGLSVLRGWRKRGHGS